MNFDQNKHSFSVLFALFALKNFNLEIVILNGKQSFDSIRIIIHYFA